LALMPGNVGKEKAWRKWKMEESHKIIHLSRLSRFSQQTACRTGLRPDREFPVGPPIHFLPPSRG
jgi:hypothetical protein